ncbi:MAG: class I SAM-dependent rRNA methyltransferase [Spirochaetales bacterium]|nr:class I SAM-dependent rRNA methyltransferase [Spirochaetales bacterium]
MYEITILQGKEKQLLKNHPWVFSGAIEKASPAFKDAGLARVTDYRGVFIAWGWYDVKSHIVLHLLSWNEKVLPDDGWFENAVKAAILRRRDLFSLKDTNTFRLIHGEADFLPGIAADVYGSEIRIIISSRYAKYHEDILVRTLASVLKPKGITVTVDSFYADSEGLSKSAREYDSQGKATRLPETNLSFIENGIYFETERGTGQKSGFYCDQRDNREIVELYASGKNVLDACSYTGAYTLHALRGGAESVLAIDSSESALRHLLYQIHLNENKGVLEKGSRERVEIRSCDVFEEMRRIEKDRFDLMILDPPKLAQTKGKLEQALKAYKDLNRVAMLKIRNGGIIATFSCSGAVTREVFRQTLAWAAADAHVEIQILRALSAGEDHPIRISFPESEYLKGYVIRVIK